MSAVFTGASSQYLRSAVALVTTAPFTVGFWLKMPTSGTYQILWAISKSSATGSDYYIAKETSNALSFNGDQGGAFWAVILSTAITSNGWTFVMAREITTANHRACALHPTGVFDHGQDTNSLTPSGINETSLGAIVSSSASDFTTGAIERYFLMNADPVPGGGQMTNQMLRQFAYRGPFSFPHLRKNIVEYRALTSSVDSRSDRANEIYVGGTTRQTWTNTNGVTLGSDCPYARNWVRPVETSRLMPVL